MAHAGGVGPHRPDALGPRAAVGDGRSDVVGVRAVDAVVGDVGVGDAVDHLDGLPQARTVRQAPIGLDREIQDHGDVGVARCLGDAQPLVRIGQRQHRHEVAPGIGEDPDLMRVILARLLRGHHRPDGVSVATGPDAPADGHAVRRTGCLDPHQEGNGIPVQRIELVPRVAERRPPVGGAAPRGGLEHVAHAVLLGHGQVLAVVAIEDGPAGVVLEEREGGERGEVPSGAEDDVGLDPRVGEHRSAVDVLECLDRPRHDAPSGSAPGVQMHQNLGPCRRRHKAPHQRVSSSGPACRGRHRRGGRRTPPLPAPGEARDR